MNHVIALLGSRRKGNTYGLLVRIQEALAASGTDMEIIDLYDLDIRECIGCQRCLTHDTCPLEDDAAMLMQKLVQTDGIILASPVYLRQVSGRMKSFIDRTCRWYHRPVLTSKPVLVVATTMGSGLKDTLGYLQSVAGQWGAIAAGGIGCDVRTMNRNIESKELAPFIKMMQNPRSHVVSVSEIVDFEVQKSLAAFLGGIDAAYWAETGWSNAPYYYPCRIRLPQKIVGTAFGTMLRSKMGTKE